MKIVVESGYATIYGPFPLEFLSVLSILNGRKIWKQSQHVRVDASKWNIKKLENSGFPIEWEDRTGDLQHISEIQQILKDFGQEVKEIQHNYHPKHELMQHQKEALKISCHRQVFAYFLEMGLGKTALTIANFCILFLEGKVEGVLIVAPKGPHKQWIGEQIPEHIDPSIPINSTLWTSGKYYLSEELKIPGKLNIFAMNIDSINTEAGAFAVNQFINLFKGKLFMIIDESHQIMNFSTQRTKMAIALGKLATYRRILTGTPLGVTITNIWSQFLFLDPQIIGIQYITAFKARYMGINPWSGKPEERNVEEFYSLIAPHMYRKTKRECLDLPEKIYSTKYYIMEKNTSKHYENIKYAFMTELASGAKIAPANALAAMVRLQQILSGFLPILDEEGNIKGMEIFSYERAKIVLDIVEQINGPIIIWCRFIEDIKSIKHVLSEYLKDIALHDDIKSFQENKKRILIMNQARGVGFNLQKKGGLNMIYYNNTFNLIHRIQSEDRGHRMGMEGSLAIFDICADKSIDKTTAENLKAKKDISQFVLDDIRQMIVA